MLTRDCHFILTIMHTAISTGTSSTTTIKLTKGRLSIAAAVPLVVMVVAGEDVSGVAGAVDGIVDRSENRVELGT